MIITISGQYGSGGNEIGQAVAEKLGYRILDSQLVVRAREIFKETTGGEKPAWWPSRYNEPFYEEDDVPIPGTAYEQAKFKLQTDLIGPTEQLEILGSAAEPMQRAMYAAQKQAILEYVEGGDCVILGKCSNFVLRDRKDAIHVFTKADLESRIRRIMNLYNLTMDKVKGARWIPPAYFVRNAGAFFNMSRDTALELIEQTDHRRASCYEFITCEQWGCSSAFDFVFDGSNLDLTGPINILLTEIEKREGT